MECKALHSQPLHDITWHYIESKKKKYRLELSYKGHIFKEQIPELSYYFLTQYGSAA